MLSWTPSSNATGYRINYSNEIQHTGSDSGVSGGSTDNYTLTDLMEGATYSISIEAVAFGMLDSPPTQLQVSLG